MSGDPIFFSGVTDPGPEKGRRAPDVDICIKPEVEGYKIGPRIGRGGMGTVWRATQLGTKRTVALKVMNVAAVGNNKAREWFEREITLAARLEHPNIARVYDSGVHRRNYYYAMKLIEGQPLDQYVKQADLSHRSILELMLAVCQAVQHAHQRGVIHRDLKPSNIIVTPDGCPYVVDFGLAQEVLGTRPGPLEKPNGGLGAKRRPLEGTLAFMAPEQADDTRDQPLDTRTDVYALGVILYRLLTGKYPHDPKGSPRQVQRRILDQDVPAPRKVNPAVHWELESLMLKALAREPEQRYASAGELARDIDAYLSGEPIAAVPGTTAYVLRKHLRKHRGKVSLATAAVLGLFMFFLYGLHLRNQAYKAGIKADQARAILEIKNQALERSEYSNNIALAQSAFDDHNYLRAKQWLDKCAPRLRQWEWHYLRGGLDQSWLSIPHSRSVSAVTFSPIESPAAPPLGGRLITADSARVAVYDAGSARLLKRWPVGEYSPGRLVVLSPDGRRLASMDRQGVRVVDLASNDLIYEQPTDGKVFTAAFDHQSRVLAIGFNDRIELVDLGLRRGTAGLIQTDGRVTALAFSRDGQSLAAGGKTRRGSVDPSDGNPVLRWTRKWVARWDTDTLQPRGGVFEPTETTDALVFSRDGSRLFAGGRTQIHVIDAHGMKVIQAMDSGGGCLALCPEGKRLVSSGSDDVLTIWDVPSLGRLGTRRGHLGKVNSLAISPDGRQVVSCSDDGTVKVWSLEGQVQGLDNEVPFLDISIDSRWIARKYGDRSVQVVDTQTGDELEHPRAFPFNTDRPALPGLVTGPLAIPMIIDLGAVAGAYLPVTDHPWLLESATFSPDARSLVCRWSSRTGLWAVTRWGIGSGEVSLICGPRRIVRVPAFSPHGQVVVAATKIQTPSWAQWLAGLLGLDTPVECDQAEVWDPVSGARLAVLKGYHEDIRSMVFSPRDPLLITGDDSGAVRTWDLVNPRQPRLTNAWETGLGVITHLSISSDGRRLLVGDAGGMITLMDSRDGRQIVSFRGHERRIALSPNGRQLAWAKGGEITILDADSGHEMLRLPSNEDTVMSLVFSSAGQRLFSGGSGAAISVWDLEAKAEVLTISGHRWGISRLAFEPENQQLTSVDDFGSIRIWRAGKGPAGGER